MDPPPAAQFAASGDRPLAGRRILLVEDSPADHYVYKSALTRAGADVAAVTDGPLAIAAAACRTFDAIVVDLMLPGMRGTEVVANLRARGYAGRLVGLSAYLTDEISELWVAAGCDEVLAKRDGGLAAFLEALRALLSDA